MMCKKLSQLYLEVEPENFLIGIDKLIENLSDLTMLYLASMNMPVCLPPVEDIDLVAKNLLESVPTSSKLSLLVFELDCVIIIPSIITGMITWNAFLDQEYAEVEQVDLRRNQSLLNRPCIWSANLA